MAAEFDELAGAVGDYQQAIRDWVQVEQRILAALPPPRPRRRSRLFPLLIVAVLALTLPFSIVGRARFVLVACNGVQVDPTDDLQALITANATGTTFCLRAGTLRVTQSGGFTPKSGDIFIGVGQAAVVDGAKVIAGSWTTSGSNRYATGFLPDDPGPEVGTCADATPLCNQPQDVFFDGTWLSPVESEGELATGKVYLDYTNNRIYIRDDPAGHTVEQSWASHLFTGSGDDVQIKNLILQHAASEANSGALDPSSGATGWLVDHNEVRWNHGLGIGDGGDDMTVTANNVHHMGQDGVAVGGDGNLVQGNEVHHNTYAGFDVLWDGGNKLGQTNLRVTGNYVHDEIGVGIWCDIDCDTVEIDNNYVKTTQRGIMFEISCNASIHDNIVVDSVDVMTSTWGGIGILIAASEDVEVYNNQTYNDNRGIWAVSQERGDGTCTGGSEHVVKNLNVHDNFVDLNGSAPPFGGKVGLWNGDGRTDLYATLNNHFEANTYYDTAPSSEWNWGMSSPPFTSVISFASWQSAGNDNPVGSVVSSDPSPPSPPALVVGPRP